MRKSDWNSSKLSLSILSIGLLTPISASAELGVSLSVVSDYIDRGITNTDKKAAIQGSLDYSHDNGTYLGVWASNVDFDDGGEASSEVDFYIGYAGELGHVSWDVGLLRFIYPGADKSLNYDSNEFYLSASYPLNELTLSTEYYYSNDYFGSGASHYISLGLEAPLPNDFSLAINVGRQQLEDNIGYGLPDYNDWRVSIGKGIDGFDFSLSVTGTSIDSAQCYGPDWCDTTVSFSISRDFTLLE